MRASSVGLFAVIAFIWGSSFILMKLGLYDRDGLPLLSAYQVSALRVLSAGLAFLPIAIRHFRNLTGAERVYCFLSGLLGIFIPAFLFCFAETRIDSSLAGSLNALTPFFVLLVGALFFGSKIALRQVGGMLAGLAGILLLLFGEGKTGYGKIAYSAFILFATLCYGINVNLVRHKLSRVPPLRIVAVSLVLLILPALAILAATGYFSLPLTQGKFAVATGASFALGIFGTAVAWLLFYKLASRTTPVFASTVTFVIPLVAIAWGLVYGELLHVYQVFGLLIILGGVFLTMPARSG